MPWKHLIPSTIWWFTMFLLKYLHSVMSESLIVYCLSPVQVYQVWMRPQMMALHLSQVCFTLLLFSLEKRCSSRTLRLGSSSSGSFKGTNCKHVYFEWTSYFTELSSLCSSFYPTFLLSEENIILLSPQKLQGPLAVQSLPRRQYRSGLAA